ncbi:hypothetical protein [Hoeflea sp.]|uniref:hypothetical protein n=1 Tax=Hoeflea sp. TaxID=1940281 RepID=UPI003B01A2BE
MIENLCAVDHAFTTISKNDAFNWSRTHNAIMQGVDELFLTGIGPELELGSVVPLYLTKSDFIPDMYRGGVGRIYFTASPTIENSKAPSARDNRFNNATFLYKCLELKEKIPFAELKELGIIPHARSVQAFGHTKSKLSNDRKSALWNFIFQNDLANEQRVEELFNATRTLPKVAISYAGEDWIAARRLASWLRHYGVQSFLVTSTGSLGVLEAAVLERLLVTTQLPYQAGFDGMY